jgi:alkanesulfonate monooxygenase SsuD/methylene tetrahydromethanopterin reductase-like flavin-dependent oxidoreductase (luciferase family)
VHRAEDLGYNSITVTDHISSPRLAPFSTLAAIAAVDSRLRLLSTVFGNDFRHPAFLASEAATIDLISEGRLELGVGTGWLESDYEQTGIPFDSAGTRVNRLIEAVQLIKALFTDDSVTFTGQYYTVRGLNLRPKPVQ